VDEKESISFLKKRNKKLLSCHSRVNAATDLSRVDPVDCAALHPSLRQGFRNEAGLAFDLHPTFPGRTRGDPNWPAADRKPLVVRAHRLTPAP
jgi:hypothetical protein